VAAVSNRRSCNTQRAPQKNLFRAQAHFLGNFAMIVALNPQNSRREHFIMGKKLIVITLAVFAFAFGCVLRSNAGTEMIEPYRAPARTYSYVPPPPPRPVLYFRPPTFGVFFGPGFGYYGPRFYGPHRYYGRHAYWRGRYYRWR
jgi:hypothetical protein